MKPTIRKTRTMLGMTQQEFANALGVSKLTVSQWETGYRKPSLLATKAVEMLRELSLMNSSAQAIEKRLRASFEHLNRLCFRNKLKPVSFKLSKRMKSTRARISPSKRIVTISVPYLQQGGWEKFNKTILHEMVHLWLYQRERPYGHTKEFKMKLKKLEKTITGH